MRTTNNNAATQLVNSNESVNGNVTNNEAPVYFSGHVGTFAKHTDKKGSPVFGMVDSIFNNGRRVGFVHSEGETWTSELIWADDIAQCANVDEIEIARKSAVRYYENEAEYIRVRIARRYEIDDEQKLAEMLADCEMLSEMLTYHSEEDVSESDEADSTK